MTYEADRLSALKSLNLLDTPPSESFDRITRMAAQIFGLPIAAVSLTDTDRQWFKSRVGVDHWQIPRELAPCGQVADSCDALVVRDLLADDHYESSVLAQSGVRFYAGAPLTTREGYTLGAMCVLGTEPRDVTPQEVASLKDLAAMVMAQIELQHAFGRVDPMTGLPNQNQLIEDLVDSARDAPDEKQIAYLVDLLPPQQLSDALRVVGVGFVEALTRGAVDALRGALPTVKIYHIDRAHLGFVLPGHEAQMMHQTVERVQRALSVVEGHSGVPFMVRPAIGLAPFVSGTSKPENIIRSARSAAQDARNGDRPFAIYSVDQDDVHKRRFTLLADLPAALTAASQLRLVFQPRVDIASGRCVGAEALLRWTHPTLGVIPPAEFIPVVEKTGLISALTDWVVDAALEQLTAWQAEGRSLVLSINISAANIEEEGFARRLLARVAASGVPPSALELELTESALIGNGMRAVATLTGLREAGLRIAVDDFGTGYSSLSYLRMVPADCVKIDRSFIQAMETDAKDRQLVSVMIDMLHGMNFRVVAEGIESARTLELLAQASCDEAQGYYLAKPLSGPAFEDWLASLSAENSALVNSTW